jgi:hypothetical protein
LDLKFENIFASLEEKWTEDNNIRGGSKNKSDISFFSECLHESDKKKSFNSISRHEYNKEYQ